MNASPVVIETALWYYCRIGDHPEIINGVPGFVNAARELHEAGLIKKNTSGPDMYVSNQVPMNLYVNTLGNVPFPVKQWVMPSNEN